MSSSSSSSSSSMPSSLVVDGDSHVSSWPSLVPRNDVEIDAGSRESAFKSSADGGDVSSAVNLLPRVVQVPIVRRQVNPATVLTRYAEWDMRWEQALFPQDNDRFDVDAEFVRCVPSFSRARIEREKLVDILAEIETISAALSAEAARRTSLTDLRRECESSDDGDDKADDVVSNGESRKKVKPQHGPFLKRIMSSLSTSERMRVDLVHRLRSASADGYWASQVMHLTDEQLRWNLLHPNAGGTENDDNDDDELDLESADPEVRRLYENMMREQYERDSDGEEENAVAVAERVDGDKHEVSPRNSSPAIPLSLCAKRRRSSHTSVGNLSIPSPSDNELDSVNHNEAGGIDE